MMHKKLAVLLYGIVGSKSGRNRTDNLIDYELCYKLINRNILSQYDCDVFMHSWSKKQEKDLVKLYKPVKHLFQKQEHFGYAALGAKKKEILRQNPYEHEATIVSRYNSFERANNLKKEYEIQNNCRYEWVITIRYDTIVLSKLNLSPLNPEYFYINWHPYWMVIPEQDSCDDTTFLSGSENIDKYAGIIQEINSGIYHHLLYDPHVLCHNHIVNIMGIENIKHHDYLATKNISTYRGVLGADIVEMPNSFAADMKYMQMAIKEQLKDIT
jgi:hypothetical protein